MLAAEMGACGRGVVVVMKEPGRQKLGGIPGRVGE